MGVEASSPCAQQEHLADLLRKIRRVNSQWNLSLYEVWRPKIVEDIEGRRQSREGSLAPGGTWRLEVTGGNRDELADTQRWYTPAWTVDVT